MAVGVVEKAVIAEKRQDQNQGNGENTDDKGYFDGKMKPEQIDKIFTDIAQKKA